MNTPSAALVAQGLGTRTSPSAVSRVLKQAGFSGLKPWQSVHGYVAVMTTPAELHPALDALQAKGYAVESAGGRTLAIHGKRTRTHMDPATYFDKGR